MSMDREVMLEQITAYRRWSERIASAGQPSEQQLYLLPGSFDTVVNLGLADADYALADEAASLRRLGLEYIHLPVIFTEPRLQQWLQFAAVMEARRKQHLLVHCAANKRASVFLALYFWHQRGWPWSRAASVMHSVWRPDPIWRNFLDNCLEYLGGVVSEP